MQKDINAIRRNLAHHAVDAGMIHPKTKVVSYAKVVRMVNNIIKFYTSGNIQQKREMK